MKDIKLHIEELALKHRVLLLVVADPLLALQLSEQLDSALYFPDWETLAYDSLSPHQDIISQRLQTLYKLVGLERGIIIISATTALQRLCPPEHVLHNTLCIKVGDVFDLSKFRVNLDQYGYKCVSQVMEHGEFAVRGSILDLFPMGSTQPLRIDFLDNEVDSIRTFAPSSQLSIAKISAINILPAKEFPISTAGITMFRNNWREYFSNAGNSSTIYDNVSNGIMPEGIEYYLSLFFAPNSTSDIFSYVEQAGAKIITIGHVMAGVTNYCGDISERYLQYQHDITRPILAPNNIFLDVAVFAAKCAMAINIKVTDAANAELVMQQRNPVVKKRSGNFDVATSIRNLSELTIGAPVVHLEHGVGRYIGLTYLEVGGNQAEFLTIEYAHADKLYVPVTAVNLIARYSGADVEHAPLHQLGSSKWQQAKQKAVAKIRDAAAELLEIYAQRELNPGRSLVASQQEYDKFAASFPFVLTADQSQAITAVLTDLAATKTIDRVICGDVGFGKTEVAMRAAFVAVCAKTQVAILVPTTLLAQQHYNSFQSRFADFNIKIAMLSRFCTAKQQSEILVELELGEIDIVIGTHKLLSKSIKFKDLGLLVVDEEHRFGVTHKEKLKELRSAVDIITLTATPIPRTLNMAMSGIRDLSIIATPPAKRLSIKTFVRERNKNLIKEAIMRELHRGGQVYFVHNKVATIAKTAAELQELLPNSSINIAHGQMSERELETVMCDFYAHKFSVLVCTTIIETGIDIPAANTIILDRADKFGLAQLHQLRGRVGRSHHQAYAFCLIPGRDILSSDAKKRLEALEALEHLGAGFTLALQDLEIRGAGALLGDQQSGHIHEIGFNLYTELLKQAVKDLQEGKELNSALIAVQENIEVDLGVSALLPEDYIMDVNIRLVLYKRIAAAETATVADALQVEILDRFGLLPAAAVQLFAVTKLKLLCSELGISKLKLRANSGNITFKQDPNINTVALLALVQKNTSIYSFSGPNILKFQVNMPKYDDKLQFINELLTNIAEVKHA